MEDIANHGVAEHWFYKNTNSRAQRAHNRAQQWIRELVEMQKRSGNAMEFINHVKHDLFPDEVYVFSPKGGVFSLPAGATPIDFAYAVHTDIGNTCIACRINRRLAPLSQKLDSGDTIEIVTTASAKPNMSWLNFVATAKASSNIRHALKHQATDDAVNLGRRLLNQELGTNDLSLDTIDAQLLKHYVGQHKLTSVDALLAEVGAGKRLAYIVATALSQDATDEEGQTKAIGPME
ncbi:MAG TPA: TGS domain-containing protein, partial [Oceanospirillaceae bacterium]|nr:TGS domain-containing protein [Oceanospirillaceae bacterium]